MWLSGFLGLLLLLAVQAAPTRKTSYDQAEATSLFFMSAAAYGTQANQEKCVTHGLKADEDWKLIPGGSVVGNCDSLLITGIRWSDCAYFIVVSDKKKEMIISFRGTNGLSQLTIEGLQSALPQSEFHGYGRVNPYFGEAHNRLWPGVEKALQDPAHKDYRVLFTGHSLGGALATLGAAHAEAAGLRSGDKIKVVTFGEPRVGSYHFAQEFDRKIPESYRVVNQQDLVPHVGPCQKRDANKGLLPSLIAALPIARRWFPCVKDGDLFYHHGYEIWYSDAMSSYKECAKGEDFECSEGHIGSHILTGVYKLDNHLHYFEQSVSGFGLANCEGNTGTCKLSCPITTAAKGISSTVTGLAGAAKGALGSLAGVFG